MERKLNISAILLALAIPLTAQAGPFDIDQHVSNTMNKVEDLKPAAADKAWNALTAGPDWDFKDGNDIIGVVEAYGADLGLTAGGFFSSSDYKIKGVCWKNGTPRPKVEYKFAVQGVDSGRMHQNRHTWELLYWVTKPLLKLNAWYDKAPQYAMQSLAGLGINTPDGIDDLGLAEKIPDSLKFQTADLKTGAASEMQFHPTLLQGLLSHSVGAELEDGAGLESLGFDGLDTAIEDLSTITENIEEGMSPVLDQINSVVGPLVDNFSKVSTIATLAESLEDISDVKELVSATKDYADSDEFQDLKDLYIPEDDSPEALENDPNVPEQGTPEYDEWKTKYDKAKAKADELKEIYAKGSSALQKLKALELEGELFDSVKEHIPPQHQAKFNQLMSALDKAKVAADKLSPFVQAGMQAQASGSPLPMLETMKDAAGDDLFEDQVSDLVDFPDILSDVGDWIGDAAKGFLPDALSNLNFGDMIPQQVEEFMDKWFSGGFFSFFSSGLIWTPITSTGVGELGAKIGGTALDVITCHPKSVPKEAPSDVPFLIDMTRIPFLTEFDAPSQNSLLDQYPALCSSHNLNHGFQSGLVDKLPSGVADKIHELGGASEIGGSIPLGELRKICMPNIGAVYPLTMNNPTKYLGSMGEMSLAKAATRINAKKPNEAFAVDMYNDQVQTTYPYDRIDFGKAFGSPGPTLDIDPLSDQRMSTAIHWKEFECCL